MSGASTTIARVDMRNEYDCGVACLAMLTGLSAREIEAQLGYRPEDSVLPELCFGLLAEEVVLLLYECGRQPLYLRTRADIIDEIEEFRPESAHARVGATMSRRRLLADHASILSVAMERQAMLKVKRADSDYGHFVVWDRGQTIDPHPSRTVEHEGLDLWQIQAAIIAMA